MAKTIDLPKNKNAGSNVAVKTGKGHFAAAAQRLAKLRSGNLQTGPTMNGRNALMGTSVKGRSAITGGPGLTVQASEAQSALNPKQRGASFKKAQRDGHDGSIG